jgi:type II secretory ATPase GspE/PulE/Tfp pilus assembly ATPase PilB-like protein/CheY-like chemotaxis protein
MQWLINAAERAGWRAQTKPVITPKTPLAEAWKSVAAAYGVVESDLAAAVASAFRTAPADLLRIEDRAVKLVPEKLARKHNILPIKETHSEIIVATSDPSDYDAEQAVQFTSGRRVTMQVAAPTGLLDAINIKYAPERAMETLLQSVDTRAADQVEVIEAEKQERIAEADTEATPVIRLTNMILHAAVAANASDIHMEPGRHQGVVRFRIDGVLRQYMQMPLPALNRVVSRIKVLGKLDIADRLRPQDGRTRLSVANKTFDMRISTVPTREAEKAVIRILNPDASRSLDSMGMARHELSRFKHLLTYREGIVVVTGPTGSGKTTTLYGGIRELADGEVNIMTVEDPVEYELQGVTQIQIDPKRDVTFASALRAILRQDPDVVFVGEIRDTETAQIALQASMTGHLVLATLHTNDAVGVIQRMVDLGLDRTSLAAALRGAVGQRLMRKLCTNCSVPQPVERDEETARLERSFGAVQVRMAVGCQQCSDTGYRGRIPINEVLVSTPEFQERVSQGAPVADLARAADRGGMRLLRTVALEKVTLGETTLQEVERVLGEGENPATTGENGTEPGTSTIPGAARVAKVPSATPASASSVNNDPEPALEPEVQRILVVEDDPIMRELAVIVLRDGGFGVQSAVDGQSALEILQKDNTFSLVTLDLNMPRLDGREVLRRLRSNVATAALPVIVLTGNDDGDTEVALMNEGADDYLRKPLDPSRLIARVRAVLRRKVV